MADQESTDVRMAVLETQVGNLQASLDTVRREIAAGFAAFETRHNITAELARQVTVLQERSTTQAAAVDRAFVLIEARAVEHSKKLDDSMRELREMIAAQKRELDDATKHVNVWRGIAVILALLLPIMAGFIMHAQSQITDSIANLVQRVEKLELTTRPVPMQPHI